MIPLLFAAVVSTVITIDHNVGAAATKSFAFPRVPPPSASDAAAHASVIVVAGTPDSNSAPLSALTDGKVPSTEDDPGANVFFKPDSWGGRIRFDLGQVTSIAQIDSYSWHPDTRAAQVYCVYGSDGTAANFDPAPGTKTDPTSVGWTKIAFVDTRPGSGERGGQYGVSIRGVGTFRYLLFDVFETESDDVWGQTFYSEIDVVTDHPTH